MEVKDLQDLIHFIIFEKNNLTFKSLLQKLLEMRSASELENLSKVFTFDSIKRLLQLQNDRLSNLEDETVSRRIRDTNRTTETDFHQSYPFGDQIDIDQLLEGAEKVKRGRISDQYFIEEDSLARSSNVHSHLKEHRLDHPEVFNDPSWGSPGLKQCFEGVMGRRRDYGVSDKTVPWGRPRVSREDKMVETEVKDRSKNQGFVLEPNSVNMKNQYTQVSSTLQRRTHHEDQLNSLSMSKNQEEQSQSIFKNWLQSSQRLMSSTENHQHSQRGSKESKRPSSKTGRNSQKSQKKHSKSKRKLFGEKRSLLKNIYSNPQLIKSPSNQKIFESRKQGKRKRSKKSESEYILSAFHRKRSSKTSNTKLALEPEKLSPRPKFNIFESIRDSEPSSINNIILVGHKIITDPKDITNSSRVYSNMTERVNVVQATKSRQHSKSSLLDFKSGPSRLHINHEKPSGIFRRNPSHQIERNSKRRKKSHGVSLMDRFIYKNQKRAENGSKDYRGAQRFGDGVDKDLGNQGGSSAIKIDAENAWDGSRVERVWEDESIKERRNDSRKRPKRGNRTQNEDDYRNMDENQDQRAIKLNRDNSQQNVIFYEDAESDVNDISICSDTHQNQDSPNSQFEFLPESRRTGHGSSNRSHVREINSSQNHHFSTKMSQMKHEFNAQIDLDLSQGEDTQRNLTVPKNTANHDGFSRSSSPRTTRRTLEEKENQPHQANFFQPETAQSYHNQFYSDINRTRTEHPHPGKEIHYYPQKTPNLNRNEDHLISFQNPQLELQAPFQHRGVYQYQKNEQPIAPLLNPIGKVIDYRPTLEQRFYSEFAGDLKNVSKPVYQRYDSRSHSREYSAERPRVYAVHRRGTPGSISSRSISPNPLPNEVVLSRPVVSYAPSRRVFNKWPNPSAKPATAIYSKNQLLSKNGIAEAVRTQIYSNGSRSRSITPSNGIRSGSISPRIGTNLKFILQEAFFQFQDF